MSCKTAMKSAFLTAIKPIAAAFCATISLSSFAGEGGFVGGYVGATGSLDTDKAGTGFKILSGAHVTDRLTLELGYVNFGEAEFDDPTPINLEATNSSPILFKNAEHGSVSAGLIGDAVLSGDKNTYPSKSNSTFTGISKFKTQGAIINLRYRFPLSSSFDFFLKTGFFAWVADYEEIEIVASQTETLQRTVTRKDAQTSAVNAISGGGFIYHASKNISLRAELETTAIDSLEMPRSRFQNATLGVNWEF